MTYALNFGNDSYYDLDAGPGLRPLISAEVCRLWLTDCLVNININAFIHVGKLNNALLSSPTLSDVCDWGSGCDRDFNP